MLVKGAKQRGDNMEWTSKTKNTIPIHHSAEDHEVPSLPALLLGDPALQRLLYGLACGSFLLVGLISLYVDWRWSMILLAFLLVGVLLGRCPGFSKSLPRLLIHKGDNHLEVYWSDGQMSLAKVRPGGVFAWRFLVLPLEGMTGKGFTVLAYFPPGHRRWRRWRLVGRRFWLAVQANSDTARDGGALFARGNPSHGERLSIPAVPGRRN